MRERRRPAGRDQDASTFSAILTRLCEATGALGAALVDAGGETVDYAGIVGPFEIKVAAAELQLVLALARESTVPLWSGSEQICIRSARRSFAAVALEDGYAVVLLLVRHAMSLSSRALSEAVRDLCREAGLGLPRAYVSVKEHWTRVEVRTRTGDRRRPVAVWRAGAWCPLVILGHFKQRGAQPEVGFRARLATGAEFMLVREALGRWYVDDMP